MDFSMKVSIFVTALEDVYKEEENRALPALPKMDLDDDFTEDLTAMLLAMLVAVGQITHNHWGVLEFTHVLNRLAVRYLLENKEDKDDDD